MLGLPSHPAPWSVYEGMVGLPRASCNVPSEALEWRVGGRQQVVGSYRPPSSGGGMRTLPSPGNAPYGRMERVSSPPGCQSVGAVEFGFFRVCRGQSPPFPDDSSPWCLMGQRAHCQYFSEFPSCPSSFVDMRQVRPGTDFARRVIATFALPLRSLFACDFWAPLGAFSRKSFGCPR